MLFDWPRLALLSFLFTPVALIVTGCGSDGPGAIWVDPGKYTLYKCDDLARRWKALITRELCHCRARASGREIRSGQNRTANCAALSQSSRNRRNYTVEFQVSRLSLTIAAL